MSGRYVKRGSVLLAAALALLLFGCAYPGYYGGPYADTYPYGEPYPTYQPVPPDPGQVLAPLAAGIEQLPVVGPLVDVMTGGALGYYADYGYGYDGYGYGPNYDPYYGNQYYNDGRYGYDPYYRGYNGYPYGNGYDYGYPYGYR